MKILYLYAEVMGYTMATIKVLTTMNAEVHVVYRDKNNKTPYSPPILDNLHLYARSRYNVNSLINLANRLKPDITVVSGWQDKDYLVVCRHLRSKGKIVVSGFDGQWHGGLKQKIAGLLGTIDYFKRYYSHAWIAGAYQFEYARRLGFKKQEIIFDLLSADTSLFDRAYKESYTIKKKCYPHRFLFVGRLEAVKGLDILLSAWNILEDRQQRHDWELHLIGSGSSKSTLKSMAGVTVKDFMQPDDLANEIIGAGCFVLPSRAEPWGVVVHEFAAAGLPLIASNVVGATPSFLIDGFNGWIFKSTSAESLAKRMYSIISCSDKKLLKMGANSRQLSTRITAETSAYNLLSLLD
jgi:glycosyltransferase involved in cell wall biosynthesis